MRKPAPTSVYAGKRNKENPADTGLHPVGHRFEPCRTHQVRATFRATREVALTNSTTIPRHPTQPLIHPVSNLIQIPIKQIGINIKSERRRLMP